MVRALLALLLALSIISSGVHVLANVEKLVFVPGPQAQVAEPLTGFPPPPLFRLSPDTTPRVRVTLNTSFPSATAAAVQGSAVWVALDALTVGQRYEVRICWAATTPADFTLHLYSTLASGEFLLQPPESGSLEPQWYLLILSSASYYTTDEKRMHHPDPVPVELVLDPYIFNVLPQSLLHISGVVLLVVIIAWCASISIYIWLSQTSIGNQISDKKTN